MSFKTARAWFATQFVAVGVTLPVMFSVVTSATASVRRVNASLSPSSPQVLVFRRASGFQFRAAPSSSMPLAHHRVIAGPAPRRAIAEGRRWSAASSGMKMICAAGTADGSFVTENVSRRRPARRIEISRASLWMYAGAEASTDRKIMAP